MGFQPIYRIEVSSDGLCSIVCTHIHAYTSMHACEHTCTYTHIRVDTHAHICAYANTHAHIGAQCGWVRDMNLSIAECKAVHTDFTSDCRGMFAMLSIPEGQECWRDPAWGNKSGGLCGSLRIFSLRSIREMLYMAVKLCGYILLMYIPGLYSERFLQIML